MAGWRTVVVNTHSKLSYKNNHLIFKDAYKTELIHLSEIDILLLETTDIVLSTMLVKRLVDENVLVIFCDDKRLPTAMLMPFMVVMIRVYSLGNKCPGQKQSNRRFGRRLLLKRF